MIADIYPEKYRKTIESEKTYKYDESYLIFHIIDGVVNHQVQLDVPSLQSFLYEYLSFRPDHVKLLTFLNNHFRINESYGITDEQMDCYNKVMVFRKELPYLQYRDDQDLLNTLETYFGMWRFDVTVTVPYVLAIAKKRKSLSVEETVSLYCRIVFERKELYLKLYNEINRIDLSYFELPVKVFIKDKISLELLFLNEVNKAKDLTIYSIDSLFTIFSFSIDDNLTAITTLRGANKHRLSAELDEIINSLSPKELEVINHRCNYFESELSLEEIGELIGVTRERVRQIEFRTTKKILMNKKHFDSGFYAMYLYLVKNGKYISFGDILNYTETIQRAIIAILLIEKGNFCIKCDVNYKIVFDSLVSSSNELLDEITTKCGDVVNIDKYKDLDFIERIVVEDTYSKKYPNAWIRNGVSERDIVLRMIDELFPLGYEISNKSQYMQLKTNFETKLGSGSLCPSDRSIACFLARADYCMISRGTYKNRALCPSMPDELVEEIILYIIDNGPTVYYSSIYEAFEKSLAEYGIDNYYYLKGLLDPNLLSEFKTKKDYIYTFYDAKSGIESIRDCIKQFDYIFTMDELRKRFIGLKDYTFINVLYSEVENGLIWISSEKFVYLDRIDISEATINETKEFINSICLSLNTRVISARKIFAKMSLVNKPLLAKLIVVNDSFSMFSLLKCMFKGEYGFDRPIISLDVDAKITRYDVLVNYAKGLDDFSINTIKNYVSKMNIAGLNSYLSFMEDMSDDFVQVNVDSMVKKSVFHINENDINEIENLINMMVSRYGRIDTRSFSGYMMFPKIAFHWNKYLLAGIVRSYLFNEYVVENTEKYYSQTDFIIKRLA